jgi:Superinfection immunity protein
MRSGRPWRLERSRWRGSRCIGCRRTSPRRRGVPNVGSVVVINFLVGWSGIGWIIALAMASRSIPAAVPQPRL